MPQKQKLSQNKKLNLVQKIFAGELGIGEAARIAKVSKTSVQRWLDRYEVEGAAGFLPQEKNRVYSPEVKLSAVQDYLSGKGSLIDVCKKYKIKRDNQLLRWIEVYNAHGDFNFVKYSGGSYMKQGRETTQEERIRIAKECYASGKNYGEIALKYNVSYQQARSWTLRYVEARATQSRNGARSAKKIGRGSEEGCLSQVRQGHLYKVIKEYCAETGNAVEEACSMLQVSRAAFYRWLSGKKSPRMAENEIIAEKMEQIHMESPDKGYRRINDDLRHDHGIFINDKRALRICRKRDIKSTIKYNNHGCTRQAKNPQHIAENVLNRDFHAKSPNEKWLTDVTEFKWYEGIEVHKVYLSAILDLYDRRIVSFVIGDRNIIPSCLRPLTEL